MKQLSFLSSFIVVLVFSIGAFATGVTDRSFGVNGTVSVPIAPQSRLIDVLSPSDGKLIVVSQTDGQFLSLMRFLNDGSLDAAFGNNGNKLIPSTNFLIYDAQLQMDGKVVLVGSYRPLIDSTNSDFLIIRLTSDGNYDPTFSGGMVTVNQGSNDDLRKLDIHTNGKIAAVGHTTDLGGREALFQFNTDGTLDTTFGGGGFYFYTYPVFSPSNPYSYGRWGEVTTLSDGRILTGANIISAQGGTGILGYTLHMLSADGNPDLSFGNQGVLGNSGSPDWSGVGGLGFDALPDGRICIAYTSSVFITNPNGTTFRRLAFEGNRVQVMPDGNLLVSGSRNGVGDFRVYSERNIIGKGVDSGLPFPTYDGKIVTAKVDGSLIVKRYERLTSQGTFSVDFDKDEKADLALLRGNRLLGRYSENGLMLDISLPTGSQVVSGVINFFTPSTLRYDRGMLSTYRRGTSNGLGGRFFEVGQNGFSFFSDPWGIEGDIPVGGDFDGNGTTERTVFRPSDGVWYSLIGPRYTQWGTNGDKPVPADYDYDGITDLAVYRPSTGTWWVLKSSGGSFAVRFGLADDIPLTGDYDGDGFADLTVYRPSEGNWYQQLSTDGFRVTRFGLATDKPVPGDYDGDGRHDIAVYRAGVWYLLKSTEGFAAVTIPNSLPTDTPVTVRYDE